MKHIPVLIRIVPILLLAVSAAHAQEPSRKEERLKADSLVMKRIELNEIPALATAFEASLVTAQLVGGERIVAVRRKSDTEFAALDWFGLRDRDVIERVNGIAPRSRDSVLEPLRGLKAGDEFTLVVLHDRKRSVHVLRAHGAEPMQEQTGPIQDDDVQVLNEDDLEAEFNKQDPWDLLTAAAPTMARDADGNVIGVTSSSIGNLPLARMLGIQNGDIIQSVNGYTINSELAIFNLVNQLNGQRTFVANILRNGKPVTLRYRVK